jgi:hypothetical protein
LTEEQVGLKIAELKSTKKEGRRQRTRLEEKIKVLRAEMDDIRKADQKIEAEMSAMCIGGRNAYSKGAIQQDFAAGIKELDQELAVEDDEEHFDPSIEIGTTTKSHGRCLSLREQSRLPEVAGPPSPRSYRLRLQGHRGDGDPSVTDSLPSIDRERAHSELQTFPKQLKPIA